MSDTTTMRNSSASTPAPPTLELQLATAVAALREMATEMGTHQGDYWSAWSGEAMAQRPLVLVAAVMREETAVWLMPPNSAAEGNEGVLSARVVHEGDRYLTRAAGWQRKGKLLDSIAGDVSWLMWEESYEHLHEMHGQALAD